MYKYFFIIAFAFCQQLSQAQEPEILSTDYNESFQLYNEGLEWLEQKTNLNFAIGKFKDAIVLNPYNSDFELALSLAYSELNILDSAISSIQQAIKLSSGQSDYYNQAANISFKQKIYEKATEYYSLAIDANETTDVKVNLTYAYFNRGASLLKLHKYELANDDFTRSIDIDNTFVGAYHNRGVARLKLKQETLACADFAEAVNMGSELSQKYITKYCD